MTSPDPTVRALIDLAIDRLTSTAGATRPKSEAGAPASFGTAEVRDIVHTVIDFVIRDAPAPADKPAPAAEPATDPGSQPVTFNDIIAIVRSLESLYEDNPGLREDKTAVRRRRAAKVLGDFADATERYVDSLYSQ